jgi:hypothetical protein
MGIRETQPADFVAAYHRPRFGSGEAEQTWREQCQKDKDSQKMIACVARGCSVELVVGTTAREGEPLTAADVGGADNLDRLRRVGAVSIIGEREAATNRGEFEFRFTKAIAHNGKIWDEGEGFHPSEMDVPAEEPVQRIDGQGRVVMTQGRPAVVGAELTEEWIKRDLAERAKLLAKVIAKAKKILKGEAKAESGS